MNDTNDNKIADRIRKLIRLSESSNESEAQNALRLASSLAGRYHLDMAALRDTGEVVDEIGARKSDVLLYTGGRQRRYRWELAHVVASAHGCAPWPVTRTHVIVKKTTDRDTIISLLQQRCSWLRDDTMHVEVCPRPDNTTEIVIGRKDLRRGGTLSESDWSKALFADLGLVKLENRTTLVMIGRKEAADAAIYIYHLLLQSVDEIAKRVAGGRAGLNSARLGLVYGLDQRLDTDDALEEPEFEDDAAEPSTASTALVLAEATEDSRRFLADSLGFEPYSKAAPRHSIKDRGAFERGRKAADEIDLPDPNGARSKLGGGVALPVGKDRQLG